MTYRWPAASDFDNWASTTASVAEDTAIKSTPGYVWWLLVQNTDAANPVALELNNSIDNSGTDLLKISLPSATDEPRPQFLGPFNPPIEFDTGIYLDLTGGAPLITVGYT